MPNIDSEPTLAKVADKQILFVNAYGDKSRHGVFTRMYFVFAEFQASKQSLARIGVLGMRDIHVASRTECTLELGTQHLRSQDYTDILRCVHRERPETPCIMTRTQTFTLIWFGGNATADSSATLSV